MLLKLRDFSVSADSKELVKNIDLDIAHGKIHAIMGPNGAGKSSLASALMGKPGLSVSGSAILNGVELLRLDACERADRKSVV